MGESSRSRLTEKTKIDMETEQRLNDLQLIGKTCIPQRKDPGNCGRICRLDTNIFMVQTGNVDVYRYDLRMTGRGRQGRTFQLDRRGNDS